MSLSHLCAAFAATMLITVSASASDYETFTLDNGLEVVLVEKHDVPVVAVYAYVKTGSIHEDEFLGCGISHYAEHLVSGGTTSNRSEAETSVLLKQLGDRVNAYTTLDHTCYYIETDRQHWAVAAELIAEWLGQCAFAEDEVTREKGVITQEIRMGMDEPGRTLWHLLQSTVYRRSPMRVPVIGHAENFAGVTREDLQQYYDERYVANNMILAIAGDVTRAEVEAVLARTFAHLRRGRNRQWLLTPEPMPTAPRVATTRFPVQHAQVEIAFPSIPLDHPDLYALDLLAQVLGDGESAPLVKQVKDEARLVYSISAGSWTPSYERGLFTVSFTCEETNINAAVSAVLDVLHGAADKPFSEGDLARATRRMLLNHYSGLQTVGGLASDRGGNLLSTGDPAFSDRYVARLRDVEARDVMRVAGQYIDTNVMIKVALLPSAGQEREAAETDTGPDEPELFTVHRLSNGMRVALLPRREIPVVTLALHMPGGLIYETPQNNGISILLARMLKRGTTTRNADEINRAIEERGANLSFGATRDSFSATMRCLSEDTEEVLSIFADTLRNPAFPPDELEKQRTVLCADIAAERDSWWREASLNFLGTFFEDHPFALSQLGSTNSVPELTQADLRAFHDALLQPTNMVIALAGDFDTIAVLELCERYLGDIVAQSPPPPRAGEAVPELDGGVLTRGTERNQATVVVGYPGLTLKDDGRYAMQYINSHVNGFGGSLFRALRGDADLVYVVFAYPLMEDDAGALLAMAQCQPHRVNDVVVRITNVFAELALDALPSNAMRNARNALVIPYLSRQQSLGAQAGSAALWEYRGRGANFARDYPARIDAVSPADVQACADTCFGDWVAVVTTPHDPVARAQVFLRHFPDATAQDVYKVVYQGVAGPRHLGAEREALDQYLRKEWDGIEAEAGPLWLPIGIGDDWAWLNLKAWKHQDGDLQAVSDALWASVNAAPETANGVSQAWAGVTAALEAGRLEVSDDWRAFDARVRTEGHPVKHHTQAFIDAYDPAYRVVLRRAWQGGGQGAQSGPYAGK